MNKKIAWNTLLALILATGVNAQSPYKTTQDAQGNKILTGKINEKLLANDSAFRWFYQGVNNYKPNAEWTKYISFYRDSFDVIVFAGTWDALSRQLLPVFYRVMMASSYPMNKITLYGVDHQLHTLGNEAQQHHITKIPTVILLHQGKEIGRIEQHPVQSVEANMAAILQKKYLGKEQKPGQL